MCRIVLPASTSVCHMHAVARGCQKRASDPLEGYRRSLAALWVLGWEPDPLEEKPVFLAAAPSLQTS